MQANEAFHDRIHRVSRCNYLGRLIERQRFYDASTRRIIHSSPEERLLALEEHTTIGRSIIAHDADGAERAMRGHVMRSGELYLQRVFGNADVPMGQLDAFAK